MEFTEKSDMISLLFSPSLLLLLLLPFVIVFLRLKYLYLSTISQSLPLPPGPKPWPIVGNLLQIGREPHITIAHFSNLHGPLISLKLGSQLLIIASSPSAAAQILKTHDRILSARHLLKMISIKGSDLSNLSLMWASECSSSWKFLRALCRSNLFTPKAIDSQAFLRERKMEEMVRFLNSKEGKMVDIADTVFTCLLNLLYNIIFSMDLFGYEEESEFKGILKKMTELGLTPNVADFYPFLDRFDLQGIKKKAGLYRNYVNHKWETIIEERRRRRGNGNGDSSAMETRDFLDAMLENSFTNPQINQLALELLMAATDTTTTTIEWAMAEMMKNKEIMNKAGEEIGRNTAESEISHLPYLQACIKETLRLHPPGPFLLPHRSIEDCEIMNCRIPKNSQILVNVRAIGRDPSIWKNPSSFDPERFIGSDLDYKGNDFELLPFGSGRRICPGLSMGAKHVEVILAILVHRFEWFLPDGEEFSQIDMADKLSLTLQKKIPLVLIPKKKV